MASCPSSCGDIELLALPKENCTPSIRQKTLARLAFYGCDVDFPSPLTDAAFKALVDDGLIVFSSELGNVQWAEPTTEELAVSDCRPASTFITGREMTAEDRIAISRTTGTPPSTVTDEYFDYDFLQDKADKQLQMNYLLVFCDGDVVRPLDRKGNPLGASFFSYINYQKAQTQGGASTEFKYIRIRFQGDPLAYYTAKPIVNLGEAGIEL